MGFEQPYIPKPATSVRTTPRLLPISVLEVHAQSDFHYWNRMVSCPLTRSHISTNTCIACPHCSGFSLKSRGNTSFLVCNSTEGLTPKVRDSVSPKHLAETTPISELIRTFVICLAYDLTVKEVVHILTKNQIHSAPVVDCDGELLGIASRADLEQHQDTPEAEISEFMAPPTHAFSISTTIAKAASEMALTHIQRALAVAGERVVGILSSADIDRWLQKAQQATVSAS